MHCQSAPAALSWVSMLLIAPRLVAKRRDSIVKARCVPSSEFFQRRPPDRDRLHQMPDPASMICPPHASVIA